MITRANSGARMFDAETVVFGIYWISDDTYQESSPSSSVSKYPKSVF